MRNLIHNLNKDNFFYSKVTTLAYAQFGINELTSRGFIIKALKSYPERNDFNEYIESFDFN
jgi:hypothetical protein